jgi:hypothetical protein
MFDPGLTSDDGNIYTTNDGQIIYYDENDNQIVEYSDN